MTLEERVARLEAVEAIRRLEAAYCDNWDATKPDAWAALFTEDGVFRRFDVTGVPGHTQRGRVQLAEFCRTLQVGWGRFHMLNTIDIEVDGSSATSRIGFQCQMTSTGDFPRVASVTGFYDTRYVSVDERWLIETKVERQIWRSDTAYFGVHDPDMPLSSGSGTFDDAR